LLFVCLGRVTGREKNKTDRSDWHVYSMIGLLFVCVCCGRVTGREKNKTDRSGWHFCCSGHFVCLLVFLLSLEMTGLADCVVVTREKTISWPFCACEKEKPGMGSRISGLRRPHVDCGGTQRGQGHLVRIQGIHCHF
jgi:hypothetical protein